MLRLLRGAERPLGIAEIAERLGVHANTVRFHLEALAANGRVEHTTSGRGAPGRPARLYRPVPGMDPTGPRSYRVLAEALAAGLAGEPDPGRRAIEAGRSWGRSRAAADTSGSAEPVSALMNLLDELGFAPELLPDGEGQQIGVHHCPFLELATERPDVVCPLHLGLMQGAMEAWGSSTAVERVEAFVEPDLCATHLRSPAEVP
ncbi:helix-turn-helix transcriptional regulator [Nocardiopsis kunsanensis]|uniref:helix-turn-helix transcriptional regulator n=1 Tax=Nocardiopsis kunsanensis TaxID=141693 RepID=UPI0018760A57|nr:helix-turn-helix domain-containing protein [Nocardiopsis kunsanensis]